MSPEQMAMIAASAVVGGIMAPQAIGGAGGLGSLGTSTTLSDMIASGTAFPGAAGAAGVGGAAGAGGGGGTINAFDPALTGGTQTGLGTLPNAGTWAQTTIPAAGGQAGVWTLPESLAGVSGATGFGSGAGYLGDALQNIGNTMPNVAEGAGITTGAPAANSSLWDTIRNIGSRVGSNVVSNLSDSRNWGGLISGLYDIYNNNRISDKLTNTAENLQQAADPFGGQRSYYQGLLKDSYANPTGVYNSPEYQSLDKIFSGNIERKDAAAGRRSQYASREDLRQNNFFNYLNNYRSGLLSPSGANIAPNTSSAADLYSKGIAAGNNSTDWGALAGILFNNMSRS